MPSWEVAGFKLVRGAYEAYWFARRSAAYCRAALCKTGRQSTPELPPRRILVVIAGLIGDSIMCAPTLRELRRAFPDAHIAALSRSPQEQLFSGSGWVDRFYVYDNSALPLKPEALRKVRQVESELRQTKFDTAIVLLGDDFVPLLRRLGIRVIIGSGGWFSKFLTHKYDVGDIRTWGPKERVRSLSFLGISPQCSAPRLKVSGEELAQVMVKVISLGISGNRKLVLLHPFASTATRSLSPMQVAQIGNAVSEKGDTDVLLIGADSKGVQEWRDAFRTLNTHVYDFVGKFNLRETCALVSRADLVITTDSGPMHIAGAFRTPTIGIFRAIRTEYATLYESVSPLTWRGGPECDTACSWDSWYGCAHLPCRQMEGIVPDDVVSQAVQLLNRNVSSAEADSAAAELK